MKKNNAGLLSRHVNKLASNKNAKGGRKRGYSAEIFAVAESEAKDHTDVHVALLGPQVRFLKGKLENIFKDYGTPIDIIDTISYGTMNGDKVLDQAISLME